MVFQNKMSVLIVPLIIIGDVNGDSESELERKYKTKLKRGETLVV
jgi:hypothetical protein